MPWETKKNKRKLALPAAKAKEDASNSKPERVVEKIDVGLAAGNLFSAPAPSQGVPTVPRNPIFKGYGDLTKAWYAEVKVSHA